MTTTVVDKVFGLSRYALQASRSYVPSSVLESVEKRLVPCEEALKEQELKLHDLLAQRKAKIEGAVGTKLTELETLKTTLRESVEGRVKSVLDATEKAIDAYLPGEDDTDEEEGESETGAKNIIEEAKTRVVKISGVATRRVRKRASDAVQSSFKMMKVNSETLQEDLLRRRDSLAETYPEHYKYVEETIAGVTERVQGTVDAVRVYADSSAEYANETLVIVRKRSEAYVDSTSEYAAETLALVKRRAEEARVYAKLNMETNLEAAKEKYALALKTFAESRAHGRYVQVKEIAQAKLDAALATLYESRDVVFARFDAEALRKLTLGDALELARVASREKYDAARAYAELNVTETRAYVEGKYALALKTFAESRAHGRYVQVRAIAQAKLNVALAAFNETKDVVVSTMSAESLRNMTLKDAAVLARLYSADAVEAMRKRHESAAAALRKKLAENPKLEEAILSFVDKSKGVWETRVEPVVAMAVSFKQSRVEPAIAVLVSYLPFETIEKKEEKEEALNVVDDATDYVVEDVIAVRKDSDELSRESEGLSEKARTLSGDVTLDADTLEIAPPAQTKTKKKKRSKRRSRNGTVPRAQVA